MCDTFLLLPGIKGLRSEKTSKKSGTISFVERLSLAVQFFEHKMVFVNNAEHKMFFLI